MRVASGSSLQPEVLGYLTNPFDVPVWIAAVQQRFGHVTIHRVSMPWQYASE